MKTKKLLLNLLAVASSLWMGIGFVACGDIATEGLQYEAGDGTYVVISGYMGVKTDIVIPKTYNGLPVKKIADYAFDENKTIASVKIPDSVTSIGERAFYGCSSLRKIVIPSGMTSIAYGLFEDCVSLTEIVIPNSVKSIGEEAFECCESLTKIIIPNSMIYIGEYAFSYCDSLTEIVIPDGVTGIGSDAFVGCDSLIIYCEAESKPNGWDGDWNPDNRPVVWGYKGE